MKRIALTLGAVTLLTMTGCATEGYVRSQVDPLADRLSKLEAEVGKMHGMTDADQAAIKQANDKAQQALDMANKQAADLAKADADAKRAADAAEQAEKAAREAEAAAKGAQKSEQKSEKIFQLEQKK